MASLETGELESDRGLLRDFKKKAPRAKHAKISNASYDITSDMVSVPINFLLMPVTFVLKMTDLDDIKIEQ